MQVQDNFNYSWDSALPSSDFSKLGKFTGRQNSRNFASWIRQFNFYTPARNWSETSKYRSLYLFLEGPALQFFLDLRADYLNGIRPDKAFEIIIKLFSYRFDYIKKEEKFEIKNKDPIRQTKASPKIKSYPKLLRRSMFRNEEELEAALREQYLSETDDEVESENEIIIEKDELEINIEKEYTTEIHIEKGSTAEINIEKLYTAEIEEIDVLYEHENITEVNDMSQTSFKVIEINEPSVEFENFDKVQVNVCEVIESIVCNDKVVDTDECHEQQVVVREFKRVIKVKELKSEIEVKVSEDNVGNVDVSYDLRNVKEMQKMARDSLNKICAQSSSIKDEGANYTVQFVSVSETEVVGRSYGSGDSCYSNFKIINYVFIAGLIAFIVSGMIENHVLHSPLDWKRGKVPTFILTVAWVKYGIILCLNNGGILAKTAIKWAEFDVG